MEGGMIEAGSNIPMSSESVLDVEDLIKKSLKAGEGIASYKNQFPKNSHTYSQSEKIKEEHPIDLNGVSDLNTLMYESENLDIEEVRNTIKKVSENQVKSHIVKIQKELSLLGKCLNQMDYKYLALKAAYASKDLDQILEVFKKKHLH